MLELLTSPEAWLSFAVLAGMEIILGIDNIVFITVLTGRLPKEQQLAARRTGLAVALISRLALLSTLSFLVHLKEPLFHFVKDWTGKDIILFAGGLFLLYKATKEIYENVEHPEELHGPDGVDLKVKKQPSYAALMGQIMLVDIVFSIDSVITAVGMVDELPIMVAAVVAAVGVMMAFAGPIGNFVQSNPSIRVLALSFLVMIGAMLVMESTGQHVSKGYLYGAMGFSLLVQVLNIRMDKRANKTVVREIVTSE